MVAESRLKSNLLIRENYGYIYHQAFTKCALLAWCVCMCRQSNGTYTLTDLLVTGGVTDTLPGAKVPCLSKRSSSMLFPSLLSSISGSPDNIQFLKRTKANLLEGIYGYDMDECTLVYSVNPLAYILVDLGEVKTISRIVVRNQPRGLKDTNYNVNIRVGDAPSAGDFDSYAWFGSNTDPVDYNQEFIHQSEVPMKGRFVSFQTISDDSIQICHLEIN